MQRDVARAAMRTCPSNGCLVHTHMYHTDGLWPSRSANRLCSKAEAWRGNCRAAAACFVAREDAEVVMHSLLHSVEPESGFFFLGPAKSSALALRQSRRSNLEIEIIGVGQPQVLVDKWRQQSAGPQRSTNIGWHGRRPTNIGSRLQLLKPNRAVA